MRQPYEKQNYFHFTNGKTRAEIGQLTRPGSHSQHVALPGLAPWPTKPEVAVSSPRPTSAPSYWFGRQSELVSHTGFEFGNLQLCFYL